MKHLPTGKGISLNGVHIDTCYSLIEIGDALCTIATYLNDLIDKGILPKPENIFELYDNSKSL